MALNRLKRAAKSAKRRVSGGGGPTISQVGDQYLVIDGEESHGPYQKRMHAAAKVRELKRTGSSGGGGGVGDTVEKGVDKLADYGESLSADLDEQGGPQLPGEMVGDETDDRAGGPVLPGMEGGGEPAIPLLDDDADGAEPARGESRLPFMDEPADGDEDGNRDDPPWML